MISKTKIILFWYAILLLVLTITVPLHELSHFAILKALGGEGTIYWLGFSGIHSFGPAMLKPTYWPIDYLWLVGLGPMMLTIIMVPFGILFWRKSRKELSLIFIIIGGLHGISAIAEAIMLL